MLGHIVTTRYNYAKNNQHVYATVMSTSEKNIHSEAGKEAEFQNTVEEDGLKKAVNIVLVGMKLVSFTWKSWAERGRNI